MKYRKIRKDPSAKCIYGTLKAIKFNQESSLLVLIGRMLSARLPILDTNKNITRVSKTLFLQPTDQWEVA